MEELVIPNPSTHDMVSYNILLEGQAMNASYQLLSLSVIKEINRIPLVKIVLRDGDAASRDFEISNTDELIPGKKIVVKIGFDGDNTQVFQGIITRQSVQVKGNGNTQLIIECRDEAVKMTVGRKSKYFENLKDSQLFDDLAGQYSGLKSDADETTVTNKELVQHHITDWDFLLLRAEANGMLVNVNDGTIKIFKPDTSIEPVLQATYGTSIIEFEAEMDARNQWKKIKAVSWDYTNQQLFDAETDEASSFAQQGNIKGSNLADTINLDNYELHHSGHVTEQALQAWVDGAMMRSRMAKIRGRVKITGFSGIKPGDMLKLEGVGDRYKGNAFVTAVKHDIGNGGWETSIQFGLDPECYESVYKNINDPLTAGLMGGIHGLQIGKVVRLASDPDGEDRILVKIPTIDNDAQGIWSRVACLDAGSDRGTFFRPEIDDEVIMGFINDDPNDAIVLGMLNSSAKKAPLQASDDNNEKGIFTRSKMRIHFNDQTKTITIDTPAGNSIKLDEQGTTIEIKDQNNNKITLGSSGIKLSSQLNIDIEAGANLSLKAGASLTIGGVNLSVKADGNISMEGAIAKLSASGITEIKGSLVKIN
ncbi:MAG: type VI secretion system tip protein VgrG [Chitinophagaceae bacterium]